MSTPIIDLPRKNRIYLTMCADDIWRAYAIGHPQRTNRYQAGRVAVDAAARRCRGCSSERQHAPMGRAGHATGAPARKADGNCIGLQRGALGLKCGPASRLYLTFGRARRAGIVSIDNR